MWVTGKRWGHSHLIRSGAVTWCHAAYRRPGWRRSDRPINRVCPSCAFAYAHRSELRRRRDLTPTR